MNSVIFYIVTHFITALVSLFVAIVVWYKNKKNITHITLSLFSLSVFFWSIFYSIWLLSSSKEEAFFWARALNLAATFIPVFLFHWILCFLGLAKKRKFLIFFYYILTLLFSFLSYSSGYIKSLETVGIFPYWPKGGSIYLAFIIVVWLPIFLYSFFLLIKEIKRRKAISQQQVVYVLIGLIIGFLGGSTNYLLVFNLSDNPPILSSFVVFFPIFFSYSIIRYRLMNIKFILRSSSVYLLSLIIVFGLASGFKILAEKFFQEFSFWIDLAVIFFAVATFPSIKNKFFKWANEYFFTSLYDSGKLILKTGNDLKTFLNIEEVYRYLYSVLLKNLHTKAFGVLTYDKEGKKYVLQYNQGFKVERGSEFDRNSLVEAKFIAKNEIVITEELKNLHYSEKTKDLIDLLERLEVELLIPLKIKGNLIGLLALGQKETEEAYNDEDLQVLEIIAGQSAVAIENARLYSRVKQFNIKLKKEVREAVKEVEKTNRNLSQANTKLSNAYKKLKQLDSAKNEFISIASHQLRTPLTSIKGFISMIIEGDYGKVEKETIEALRKIFISNERLIKLVNDLLSLSRIESGKFSFNFKKDDIVKLLKNALDSFKLEANVKKLKIKFIKSPKEIKPFVFDQNKIHEVVSNLIDNAIKYTEKGEIEVGIEDVGEKIRIIVSDSGKGMNLQELEYIFDKFRRGEDSSSINTEGTGLGLYVCKKIIDAHQGKIYAESDGPGKGSQFIVELRRDLSLEKK